MVEVREARYFIAVAEELNFGRAAERLQMSQPPLSTAIKALEKRLGVLLLYRTTREVRLTPQARSSSTNAAWWSPPRTAQTPRPDRQQTDRLVNSESVL